MARNRIPPQGLATERAPISLSRRKKSKKVAKIQRDWHKESHGKKEKRKSWRLASRCGPEAERREKRCRTDPRLLRRLRAIFRCGGGKKDESAGLFSFTPHRRN